MRAEIRAEVKNFYRSDIIDDIKACGYTKKFGRLTLHLAQEFGFCYGVDRAVELAYETVKKFPDKRLLLTTEIIHNPTVNQNLVDMGVEFLSGPYKSASATEITKDDIVIVPAFGTTVAELRELYNTGCQMVDTICGSVIIVWKRVEKYAREGFTSVIHGKYYHEETLATSSQVLQYPNGHYLVILNKDEARYVIDYMQGNGNRDEFLKKFAMAISPGFDPDLHLEKMGFANQTTMLASESLEIAEMFRAVLVAKHGEAEIKSRYLSFDTICSATQERQDAIVSLKDKNPDLFLVVGGYNSSNTGHLLKMAHKYAQSFHIDRADCVLEDGSIKHWDYAKKTEIVTKDWLPAGNFSLGITSGASTPNSVMGDVITRLVGLTDS